MCLWGEDGLNDFREVGRVLELRKDSSHAADLNQLSQSPFPSLSFSPNAAAATLLCNPFSQPFYKEKIPLIAEIPNNINPNLMYPLHFLLEMLLFLLVFRWFAPYFSSLLCMICRKTVQKQIHYVIVENTWASAITIVSLPLEQVTRSSEKCNSSYLIE